MTTDTIIAFFTTHQATILEYRYVFLFILQLLEGTVMMITAGVLIAAGYFSPVTAFIVCSIAENLDGFLWYSIGYYFGSKPIDWFIRNSPGRQAFIAAMRRHSDRSAGLVVLFVKMTYSITNATLVLVGSLKYDIRRFAFYNFIGSLGWAALLLSLGYTFGHAALAYLPVLRHIGVGVFFIIVSVVALLVLKYIGDLLLKRVRNGV